MMMRLLERLWLLCVAVSARGSIRQDGCDDPRLQYLVKSDKLPLVPGTHNVSRITYSGLIPVRKTEETKASLFFWLFPAQVNSGQPLEEKPLIIWLNGGPGSSSMIGLFYEMGPLHFGDKTKTPTDKVELVGNPWSWNKNYNVLFLDQPAGTGYSIVDPPYLGPFDRGNGSDWMSIDSKKLTDGQGPVQHVFSGESRSCQPCGRWNSNHRHGYAVNQDAVGKDFLVFIDKFYSIFPEMRRVSLHLAGESYAGKYIPAIAHCVSVHNSNHSEYLRIPLQTLAIGNQWTDPYHQIAIHGSHGLALGMFSVHQATIIDDLALKVQKELRRGDLISALLLRNDLWAKIDEYSGEINHYDVRQGNSGVERARMRSFLNSTQIVKLLHASDQGFGTDEAVSYFLSWDIMNSTRSLFPDLLKQYRILMYQGNFDFRDGVMSNSAWLDKLDWEHSKSWAEKEPEIWRLDYTSGSDSQRRNTLAGTVQAYDNLTRVIIWNAGHFVPAPEGNPQAAYEMIDSHIRNIALGAKQ